MIMPQMHENNASLLLAHESNGELEAHVLNSRNQMLQFDKLKYMVLSYLTADRDTVCSDEGILSPAKWGLI
jgi:hypothetical protein